MKALGDVGSNLLGVADGSGDGGLAGVMGSDRAKIKFAVLRPQVLKVDEEADGSVAVDADQSEVVGFLAVFVHQSSGKSLRHVGTVDGLDFAEDTGFDVVAASFGEEDRHGDVSEILSKHIVTARVVGCVTAPRVRIETEEVGTRSRGVGQVASQVVGRVNQERADIGSRVTNGNVTLGVLADVVVHITLDGLDSQLQHDFAVIEETYSDVVGNQLNTVLVDNLVTREETSSVGVVLECLNDTKDLGHVDGVVRLPRRTTVEGAVLERRVDVENHVDTGGVEDGSAVIVVSRGSQVVHTDTVDLIGVSDVDHTRILSYYHTPRYCKIVASRKQAALSLRGSAVPLKAEEPPGW